MRYAILHCHLKFKMRNDFCNIKMVFMKNGRMTCFEYDGARRLISMEIISFLSIYQAQLSLALNLG